MLSNDAVINKFLAEAKVQGVKDNTVDGYRRVLERLDGFCGKLFKRVVKEDIVGFFEAQSEGSLFLAKAVVKRFFGWFYGFEPRAYPKLVSWIKVGRPRRRVAAKSELLTLEEIKRLLDACAGQRDRALIHVLYDSGCRASELIDLKVRNVEVTEYGCAVNVNGKTGPRRIPLRSSAPDLKLWLSMHPLRDDSEAPLFPRPFNKRKAISRTRLYQIVQKYAVKAGFKKKVFPHLLRHSRLTELAGDQLGESVIRKFAGWTADSRQVGTYIHLAGADVEEALKEKWGLGEAGEKKHKLLEPVKCPRCGAENSAAGTFCTMCGSPLSLETELEMPSPEEVLKMKEAVDRLPDISEKLRVLDEKLGKIAVAVERGVVKKEKV